MPIRHRQTIATCLQNVVVQVTDDGSRTLIQTDTENAYHSASGALAETRHVYLINSGVADRIAEGRSTAVLEIGLGTGMGMLVTTDAALQAGAQLLYVALEHDWLPADVLGQLEPESWVADRGLADRFLNFRQRLPRCVDNGTYRWAAGERQTVTIHVRDVLVHQFDGKQEFDAIYFDPFAPSSNPQLWQYDLLSRLATVLKPAGRLVTYCVSRQAREAIANAGFDVARVAGPPAGKREVLIATKRPSA